MRLKLITSMAALTLSFLGCMIAGVVIYVPEAELTGGFRGLFSTFNIGAQAVLIISAASAIVITAGAAALFVWKILAGLVVVRYHVRQAAAETVQAEANAAKAEREASFFITIAPPGHQVYGHKLGDFAVTTDPLHLAPGRVNGATVLPSPDQLQRWVLDRMANATTAHGSPQLPAGMPALPHGQVGPALPNMVRWFDLVPGHRGDLNHLVLGVRLDQAGRPVPVTVSLYDLFHTIIAASSGWGKSVFANAILAQLATCREPVEFVLIDKQDHGLAPFKNCDRLRYPLLREQGEILSALREIYQEATQRRSPLFAEYDADDLAEYNRRADTFLPPIIVAVDEASALLANREIGAELKRHAWELRKFGIYQILLLTSAKGTTIDTDHRQQFSSKVQLHANERSQARLLIEDAIEATSFPPGRAMIELPGQLPAVVQTPYIDKREVRSLLRPGSPPPAPPELLAEPDKPTVFQQKTLDLWDAGETSEGALAYEVYGDGGGRQRELVKATLLKFGRS